MGKSIKFAFIQSGHAVFGVGYTRKQAISDARKWLESPDGVQGGMSFRAVSDLVCARPNDGDFTIIESGTEEFDSYMQNTGGFVKIGRGWYHQKGE